MHDFSAPNPLAQLLTTIGMRPEQLIARINQIRAHRGVPPLDPKSAYPWLRVHGPARPNRENEPDALAVLSARAGRPVTAEELGWSGPRRRRHPCWLDTPCEAPTTDLLREIHQGEPMERRTFALLAGTAATAPALALLLGSDSPAHAAATGDRPSRQLITTIERAVREVRALDDTEGSTTAGLVWADGLWKTLSAVLANASHRTEEARLHTAFIELSETYGWMLFDANHHPQAQRVYHTGLRLAREADTTAETTDHATRNLLASAAYQASWLGQHTEAHTLLNIAARNPHNLPPRLKAVIADRAIFAAGHRREAEALRRARDTAHDELRAAGDDGPWWSVWLSHHAVDAATGRAWLAARDPQAAEPYLSRRLDAAGDAFPRDRMMAALDLADTHRQNGDPDAAATLAQQAVAVAGNVHSTRAHERLRQITTALAASHSGRPPVRDLLNMI